MYLKVGKGAVGETKKEARKLSFSIKLGNTYSGEENVQRAMKKIAQYFSYHDLAKFFK